MIGLSKYINQVINESECPVPVIYVVNKGIESENPISKKVNQTGFICEYTAKFISDNIRVDGASKDESGWWYVYNGISGFGIPSRILNQPKALDQFLANSCGMLNSRFVDSSSWFVTKDKNEAERAAAKFKKEAQSFKFKNYDDLLKWLNSKTTGFEYSISDEYGYNKIVVNNTYTGRGGKLVFLLKKDGTVLLRDTNAYSPTQSSVMNSPTTVFCILDAYKKYHDAGKWESVIIRNYSVTYTYDRNHTDLMD